MTPEIHCLFYTGVSFDLRNEHWWAVHVPPGMVELHWNRNGVVQRVPKEVIRDVLNHIEDLELMVYRGILPEFPEKEALIHWEQTEPLIGDSNGG